MGHDISLYRIKEVGYYRRSMWTGENGKNHEIYDALPEARDRFYAGVSGNGGMGFFYLDELQEALRYLEANKGEADTIEFIRKAIKEAEKNESKKVAISFY